MQPNCFANWFGRVVWLGILVNLSFAVPALFLPRAFAGTLELGGLTPEAAIWLRNAGMLLVVTSGFHALVASDPLGAVGFARWAVAGRFLAAAFWLWLVAGLGLPGVLWWFFATDLTLGLVCGFLLWRALAVSPPPSPRPWRRSLYDRTYGGFVTWLERRGIKWYNLWPAFMGSLATGGLRRELRAYNLHSSPGDVPDDPANRVNPDPTVPPHPLGPWNPEYRDSRSPDGSYNDLSDPAMGMSGMRFGRNFPPADTLPKVPPAGDPENGYPNPRDVSNLLLARPEVNGKPQFIPATSLNLLAAAWIQFQNHGWFAHRIPRMRPDPETNRMVLIDEATGEPIPVGPDEFTTVPFSDPSHPDNVSWKDRTGQAEMRIHRTVPDPTRRPDAGYPPTFRTTEAHWWGASQVYGATAKIQHTLRSFRGGKLAVEEVNLFGGRETLLPIDDAVAVTAPNGTRNAKKGTKGIDLTGFNDNHWVGTSLLHTLFVLEHNLLCDRLKATYGTDLAGLPQAEQDEWLFGKARLIVAALMAKIHTVEWTPGILAHPTLRIDMDSNWWGILGRWFKLRFGRVSGNEGVSGIIGSRAEHHAAPYSLTEDFVAVYRLHPLIPDEVRVHELIPTGNPVEPMNFDDLQGAATRGAVLKHGMTNWFYSFGRQHPGAITLRNYPKALREHERITGEHLDLATRDVVRDRERGVPLYNRFRELLRMRPIRSYAELVGHRKEDGADLIKTLERLYGKTDGRDNVDKIDLLVGLLGEKVPPGFGFSDTAFRVFILMASRRLKSDRFFTDDFRPEVYTPLGIDWVNEGTMASLIARHYPKLKDHVPRGKNPFAPWS